MKAKTEKEMTAWIEKNLTKPGMAEAFLDMLHRRKEAELRVYSKGEFTYHVKVVETFGGFTYDIDMCIVYKDKKGMTHEVGIMKGNAYQSFMDNTIYTNRKEFETRVETYFN